MASNSPADILRNATVLPAGNKSELPDDLVYETVGSLEYRSLEYRVPVQYRRHRSASANRSVWPLTLLAGRLTLTLVSIWMIASSIYAAPPMRRVPDGAPGENGNLAPGANRFAQVGKIQAGPIETVEAAEDENAETAEQDDTSIDGDDPRSRRNLDSIDFRAPINRTKQNLWQKIEQAADGRDWTQVLERLDRFAGSVDQPDSEDYLVRHADGRLKSARLSMAEILGRMPTNLRAARARNEAALGKTAFEQAVRSNSLRQLNHVAVRFFGTPAGYRAADRLATQLIDRGEFALAARWLTLLQNSDADFAQTAAWKARTGLILSLTKPTSPSSADAPGSLTRLRQQFSTPAPLLQSHWPLPGGNSRHYAQPDGTGRPVMIRRWDFPTTSNAALQSTVDRLLADLTYQSVPTIPAGVPIFVDGKLVCRTFRGIEVVDVESGRHLWTTAQSASVERLLSSASSDARSVDELMPDISPMFADTVAVDRTGGPIGQFLFQNAAHGLISSDQRTVYFLDDDPVFTLGRTSIRRAGGGNASPRPDSTTSNRLKAYRLQTGEPLWQIGGPATREPFAPELAGWFFLGAPLPDQGDLFVVAQKENSIRLFCLDPDSGSTRWSQQIAFTEESLDRNLNRRLWSVQLAAAHGVVVCPTTVGWLVGVDRSTGTIVWSHRYSERRPDPAIGTPDPFRLNRGQIELANEPIGGTWVPSAPIVIGNRVVYAPAEPRDESDSTTRFLDCVNVFTGERVWSLPREQALNVTGGHGGEMIVTAPGSVIILKPDGNVRAEIEFSLEDGQPSGRGVLANHSFWLPLQKRVLLRFDLEKATLAERIEIPAGYSPLGNLAFYKGLLISHAPGGITAWELEETLNSSLAAIRSSGDAVEAGRADIVEAQLALLREDYSTAIDLLLPKVESASGTEFHQSIYGLLMQAAAGQIDSQPEAALKLLRKVQPLFETTGREGANFELQRRQLEVIALLKSDRSADAFRQLMEMVTLSLPGTMQRADDPRVTVAVEPWLSQQLQNGWSHLSEAEHKRLSTQIVALADQAISKPERNKAAERLATLFAFHPSSKRLAGSLAERAMREERFADAEHWLTILARSESDTLATTALLNRLKQRVQSGVHDSETNRIIQQLQKSPASSVLEDGTSIETALQPILQSLTSASPRDPSIRGKILLTATRSPASQQHEKSPRLIADRPSSRFRIETLGSGTGANRLRFVERSTGQQYWTVSLRSDNRHQTRSGQRLSVFPSGELFAVLSHGVLNMLSVPERRVLWTQPVEELDNSRRSAQTRDQPLEDIDEWIQHRRPGSSAAVPVVNSKYVCSRGSRSLTVFDSRTGQLQWRLEPLDRSLRISGTHDTIYLTRPDGRVAAAQNAVDGSPVSRENFDVPLHDSATVVKVNDRAIITVLRSNDDQGDDNEPAITLQARSPVTKQVLWSHTFSHRIKVKLISNDQLAVQARYGRIKLLDFQTGHLVEFEKIPTRLRLGSPELTILADDRFLYGILKLDSSTEARQPGLPSIRVKGNLIAFDIRSGKLLWTQDVPEQHLITERLDQLPFLIMTSYRREFIRQPPDIRRVMVLDKRDGSILLDTNDEPGEAGFHSMMIDTDNRFVDLLSSVERLRLRISPLGAAE